MRRQSLDPVNDDGGPVSARAVPLRPEEPPVTAEVASRGARRAAVRLDRVSRVRRPAPERAQCVVEMEIVAVSGTTLGMVNVALARRLRLANMRLVLSLHGDDIRRAASGDQAQRLFWRWLLRQANVVIAVSEGLAQQAVEFEPKIRPRLKVVHNGIDA